jgi:hypothetical protein
MILGKACLSEALGRNTTQGRQKVALLLNIDIVMGSKAFK